MEKWKEYKIGDICSKVCSGGTPSSKHTEYYDGDIPWLNTKEINFNRIYGTEKSITEEGLNNSSAKWIEENSVIVAMYGATAGKTAIAKIPLTTNQACCNLTINPCVADYRFVYYFLCHKFVELASLANGGAQQNLNAQIIKDFEISLPSLQEQNQIANILSSFDDKIEVNRRINENLEQQAQALFKYWFVDFEPFKDQPFVKSELGMIPQGWRVESLSSIADYINGLAMQKYRPVEGEKGLPVLKIKELGQGNIDDNSELCSPSLIGDKYIINDGDIIFSWSGTLMVKIWCGGKCGLNQHLFVVVPNSYPKWFVYQWTRFHLDNFIRIAKDKAVTMGHIKRGELDKAKVIIPEGLDLKKIDAMMKPIHQQIISHEIESRRLAELRDTLLPRLMSGELRVTNMDLVNKLMENNIF